MRRVGIVGAGTAGLATAALLARARDDVEILERASSPGPVGAGLLLQPTGQAVLARLGVLDEIVAGAARVEQVVGTTISGKRFMDLRYPGETFVFGVHRGALFAALRGAAERAGAVLMPGVLPATYRQVSLPRWHDAQLVLVGDAAHALSPQLGQGANLALMDAAALADAPTPAAFEAARRAQARFYGFGARALNLVFQNSFEPAAWPRDHLMGPATRVPGVRRLMLRTLSGKMFM